mmetsp:Transcript_10919/g.29184  ORF Transcript_10919/g.29184 Transcript_10919/m.29184 type:complete len:239 (+) Transcript_10919:315-1031(+)
MRAKERLHHRIRPMSRRGPTPLQQLPAMVARLLLRRCPLPAGHPHHLRKPVAPSPPMLAATAAAGRPASPPSRAMVEMHRPRHRPSLSHQHLAGWSPRALLPHPPASAPRQVKLHRNLRPRPLLPLAMPKQLARRDRGPRCCCHWASPKWQRLPRPRLLPPPRHGCVQMRGSPSSHSLEGSQRHQQRHHHWMLQGPRGLDHVKSARLGSLGHFSNRPRRQPSKYHLAMPASLPAPYLA